MEQDVTYAQVLGQVKEARDRGLKAPVLLMGQSLRLIKADTHTQTSRIGYYNPVLAYGEQKAVQDAREAGANGFIMVDLPPEEAGAFRDKCTTAGYPSSPFHICTVSNIFKRLLCPADCTIDHPSEDQVLNLDCRQLYLCCFKGSS